VTLPDTPAVPSHSLAFKAYEIEELADVYFFRPLGAILARAARALGWTPTAVTVIGGLVGVLAGSLLYDERLGLAAFALLVVHSVLDSADGQLARMTGQTSEFGRTLDGLAGYVTFAAAYVAIAMGVMHRGGGPAIWIWTVAAGIANMVHAQMYDYHRSSYAAIAIKGAATVQSADAVKPSALDELLRLYTHVQTRLVGLHGEVERAVARRSPDGRVSESDRARYRAAFYWPVRGWNFLGDNTRIYAIGVVAWLHHLGWFFLFVLGPMNVAFVLLWLWQRRADRRFLAL
jgi:phosphatidylglycerophosphate synthase